MIMSYRMKFPCWLVWFGLFTPAHAGDWLQVAVQGNLHPRHEAAFVASGDSLYLLGGRRIKPVDIFDCATRSWHHGQPPPVEVHHFQPVMVEGAIWLVGAMSGPFPREHALDHFPIYHPSTDTWSRVTGLPIHRRRGAAGAVVHEGILYVVGGIINGHWDGHVAWIDALDLATGTWTELPDAPRARDHFQAAVIHDRIYVAGGRRSSAATREVFALVEPKVDIFDLATQTWTTLPSPAGDLPTPRAGSMSHAHGHLLLVVGGESMSQREAHNEVEVLDTRTGQWSRWSGLARGRHGTGLARRGPYLYTASGSGNRGGQPELPCLELMSLP